MKPKLKYFQFLRIDLQLFTPVVRLVIFIIHILRVLTKVRIFKAGFPAILDNTRQHSLDLLIQSDDTYLNTNT